MQSPFAIKQSKVSPVVACIDVLSFEDFVECIDAERDRKCFISSIKSLYKVYPTKIIWLIEYLYMSKVTIGCNAPGPSKTSTYSWARYLLDQWFCAWFVLKYALQRGEGEKREGVQISKQSTQNL